MAAPKLEWMYRNSSEVVDSEEYLLGRPVDKGFEETTNKNEIEKDCLPSSLFDNTSNRTQVDVIRKLKEDPLEVIKQKEIERRKQLLKNPVKLKKLQNMLKDKQHSTDNTDKDKNKWKSKSENVQNIDEQLTSKCLTLMKKHGIKSLSDIKVNKSKTKKEPKKSKSRKGDNSSESDTYEDKRKKEKKKRNDTSSESSSSEEDCKKKSSHNLKHENDYNKLYKRKQRSRSNSPRHKPSNYKSHKNSPQRSRNTDSKYHSRHPSNMKQRNHFSYQNKMRTNNGLAEEEKQKRLQEMMENVQWRDKVRVENVARYKKEEAAKKNYDKNEYDGEFMRKQMAIATSSGTVESRIKSNINSIQRSKVSMNENFARR